MKTTTLLFLASLAVLASSVSAAQSQSEPVVLPTYVVASPRYLPVEQQINASLNELRQQARTPVVICPEFTALKAQVKQSPRFVQVVKDEKAARLAKL